MVRSVVCESGFTSNVARCEHRPHMTEKAMRRSALRLIPAALLMFAGLACGDNPPEPGPATAALAVSPTPSSSLTSEQTATPTPEFSAAPTPEPTATQTPVPTATPTPEPSSTPTSKPLATPTPEPSATPTPQPTPTPSPTATPTPGQKWLRKSEQGDKWNRCLIEGMIVLSETGARDEQTTPP